MSETKNPIKKPEKIALPSEEPTVTPQKRFKEPYFITIRQQKKQYFRAYDNQRRND